MILIHAREGVGLIDPLRRQKRMWMELWVNEAMLEIFMIQKLCHDL